MDSKAIEFRAAALACGLLAIIFVTLPEIDIAVARQFQTNDWHWLFPANSPLIDIPYWGAPLLGKGLIVGLLAFWLGSFLPNFRHWRAHRLLAGFVLAAALLGPVLIVDLGFKNHLGRARPAQTQLLGGALEFTPAFIPSNQCERNCSFVSGHVATSAFVMAIGWLGTHRTRRRWLCISMLTAGYMAVVRMSAGSHFLSDCLFAWFAVYFCLWLTEALFRQVTWLTGARLIYRATISEWQDLLTNPPRLAGR